MADTSLLLLTVGTCVRVLCSSIFFVSCTCQCHACLFIHCLVHVCASSIFWCMCVHPVFYVCVHVCVHLFFWSAELVSDCRMRTIDCQQWELVCTRRRRDHHCVQHPRNNRCVHCVLLRVQLNSYSAAPAALQPLSTLVPKGNAATRA